MQQLLNSAVCTAFRASVIIVFTIHHKSTIIDLACFTVQTATLQQVIKYCVVIERGPSVCVKKSLTERAPHCTDLLRTFSYLYSQKTCLHFSNSGGKTIWHGKHRKRRSFLPSAIPQAEDIPLFRAQERKHRRSYTKTQPCAQIQSCTQQCFCAISHERQMFLVEFAYGPSEKILQIHNWYVWKSSAAAITFLNGCCPLFFDRRDPP